MTHNRHVKEDVCRLENKTTQIIITTWKNLNKIERKTFVFIQVALFSANAIFSVSKSKIFFFKFLLCSLSKKKIAKMFSKIK